MSETLRLWEMFYRWWVTKYGTEPELSDGHPALSQWTTFLRGVEVSKP